MSDNKDIIRAYSEIRQPIRSNSILLKREIPSQFRSTGDNYYSNRNCPEILSLFTLQQRLSKDREKEIYYSFSSSNNNHYFNTINYPIQSPTVTPFPDLTLQNNVFDETLKEAKFPQLTPRKDSTSLKRFPILTSRSTSNIHQKNSKPIIETSMNRLSITKIPMVSNEKKKKIQLSHNSRRSER